ncbi:MAG TPA: RDD family protein [Gaiellales bacterium]|jgi:uncharacterized RDD family membrane protein YckC
MYDRSPVGVGLRAVAYILDSLVLALTILLVGAASGGIKADTGHRLLDANTGALLLITAASLVYFGGLEWAWGATVGKRILGLRVVMVNGTSPTGRAILVRTICRLIDGLFLYGVGAVLIWASPRRQRLGDRWGGTAVVRGRRGRS